jgi:hypothetical protein
MTWRRAPTEESVSLEKQFNDPFDQYSVKIPDHPSEFPNILDDLQKRLETKNEDWTIRNIALRDAISYLKGTVNQFHSYDFRQLAQGIATCLTDLRSTLVKTGSLFVAAAAMTLGQNYATSIDVLGPALFRQLSHGTTVISQSCHLALLKVAEFVQHRRTARMFLGNHRSKTTAHRQVVAEALTLIRQHWPPQLTESMQSEIRSALRKMAGDAAQQVRQAAEIALGAAPLQKKAASSQIVESRAFRERNPGVENLPSASVVANSANKIWRGEKPENDIADFIPPKTEAGARSFVRLLKSHVKNETFESLAGLEEFLPSSVTLAAEMIPSARHWEQILPQLVHAFHNEFSAEIRNLLVTLRIEPWIVGILVKEFSPQEVINAFRDGATGSEDLKFFSSLFSLKMEFQMTAELRSYLTRLIGQYPNTPESTIIVTRLRRNTPITNADDIIDRLVAHLLAGDRWLPRFEQLVISLASTTGDPNFQTLVQTKLVANLTAILVAKDPEECSNVQIFLSHAAGAAHGICFAGLIEPMLWTLLHEDRIVREQSEECYAKLSEDPQCLSAIYPALERDDSEKQHAVLTLLLRLLGQAGRDETSSMIPQVMRSAQKLLGSSVTAIRRLMVLTMVEFKKRAPIEFGPYFRELSAQQQRLIETYAMKRGD